jgi:hypothetical protein
VAAKLRSLFGAACNRTHNSFSTPQDFNKAKAKLVQYIVVDCQLGYSHSWAWPSPQNAQPMSPPPDADSRGSEPEPFVPLADSPVPATHQLQLLLHRPSARVTHQSSNPVGVSWLCPRVCLLSVLSAGPATKLVGSAWL